MKKKILAIIPCRSGSKVIKDKNIISVFGKPLIYYSIIFAQQCKFIDKIIVSTDSKKYKKIIEKYGVKVPFLRPKNISGDFSLDIDVFKHALSWLNKNNSYVPDLVVHLRPTCPIRRIKTLKKAIKIISKSKKVDSVRSISHINQSAYKMWFMKNNNKIKAITINNTNYKEPYNAPRQKLAKSYVQNSVYDVIRTNIIKKNLLSGKNIYGLVTNDNIDIDTKADLKKLIKNKEKFKNFKKYILS